MVRSPFDKLRANGLSVRRLVNPLALGLFPALLTAFIASAEPTPASRALDARPVSLNELKPEGAAVGRLKPLGMLSLPRTEETGLSFSQLSGLAWDEDEGVLYALTDKGALFHLVPSFRAGKLAGVSILRAFPLLDATGRPLAKRDRDTEGLDILDGRNNVRGDTQLIVSFERIPRVVRFTPEGRWLDVYTTPAALRNPKAYQGNNDMLEAVCRDPELGILTTPEAPLREEPPGQTRLFSDDGRAWRYAIGIHDRISAIECLGDGKVLVLERDFGRVLSRRSVKLRLAHLPREPVAGETVSAETLAILDIEDGYQVDNFEGLARHRANRFFMVSDNNDLFIQRTLLLYFELLD
jgi:hypothetical protein